MNTKKENKFVLPLDVMKDGREYESLKDCKGLHFDIATEMQRSLLEIEKARGRHAICYLGNVIKGGIDASINGKDDLPFAEMIMQIPKEVKEIDIVLVTAGGLADQVSKFVTILRPRFDKVNFILLDKAMSAGTIFIMSGDEIVMSKNSHFGPIDPQIQKKDGMLKPAQAIIVALNDIKRRGDALKAMGKPIPWTDVVVLKNLDLLDFGMAITASQHSADLVRDYLVRYKFREWRIHSKGNPVSDEERVKRASEIAQKLCDHGKWKSHGHAIYMDEAEQECKLKIIHAESIPGLEKAMRRMWALCCFVFDKTNISKLFISDNYKVLFTKN